MREMTRAIFEEFWTVERRTDFKYCTRYREEFKQVDALLVRQPEVLSLVHRAPKRNRSFLRICSSLEIYRIVKGEGFCFFD